jgi:hypothetical protein
MFETKEAPACRPGLRNSISSKKPCIDTETRPPRQAEIASVKRDLLREYIYEAAQGACDYSLSVQHFVACDDPAGLEYSTRKFVAFANELARGCRQLLSKPGDSL